MRERIFTLIKRAGPEDRLSRFYDTFIMIIAFISVVPLMFKETNPTLDMIDIVTVYILFADYVFQWITYDFAGKTKGAVAFIKYPFMPLSIIDLVSLLPSLGLIGQGWRILRMLRIFKVLRYSPHVEYIFNVFKKERKTLLTVLYMAVFYIFISALAIFIHEPDSFKNFFDAMYWATTALTTVGYGDISPVSEVGRLISMISSLFGIAIIAMPAGIVTAGFVEEMNANKGKRQESAPAPAIRGPLFSVTKNGIRYLVIMLIGIAMNELLHMLAESFNLPIWLDISGTAFAALMLEPAAGLVVGLVNNMFLSISEFGSGTLVFYAVSAAVAIIVGVTVKKEGRIRFKNVCL